MRSAGGPERVEGHEELPGDLWTGEVNVEKAQDPELSFAERVGQRSADGRSDVGRGGSWERERDEAVRAAAALREIVETHLDDEERTAFPATYPPSPPRTSPHSVRDRPRCHEVAASRTSLASITAAPRA